MTIRQAAALLALALAPALAQAQGFLELAVGQTTVDLNGLEDLGFTVDDNDTTFAVSAGYMFNPMFGGEIGYRDLGSVGGSISGPGGTGEVKIDASGFFFGLLGRIALTERLSLVPRFGLYRWEADVDGTVNGAPFISDSDDGVDPYFGVGAQYAVSNQVHIGAHYALYDLDGDDVDVLEMRIGFSF